MRLIPSGALIYARPELERELEKADWRLQLAVLVTAEIAADVECDFVLTSVERDFEETQRLYREAGKRVPSNPGVHDVRPTRGADGVPKPKDPGQSILELGPAIALRVNQLIRYPRGYRTAMWHDISGVHLHCQVPYDGLVLVADPLRA